VSYPEKKITLAQQKAENVVVLILTILTTAAVESIAVVANAALAVAAEAAPALADTSAAELFPADEAALTAIL
jgi:hypothetical protein